MIEVMTYNEFWNTIAFSDRHYLDDDDECIPYLLKNGDEFDDSIRYISFNACDYVSVNIDGIHVRELKKTSYGIIKLILKDRQSPTSPGELENYWYMSVISVRVDKQGNFIATQLINAMVDFLKQEGVTWIRRSAPTAQGIQFTERVFNRALDAAGIDYHIDEEFE